MKSRPAGALIDRFSTPEVLLPVRSRRSVVSGVGLDLTGMVGIVGISLGLPNI